MEIRLISVAGLFLLVVGIAGWVESYRGDVTVMPPQSAEDKALNLRQFDSDRIFNLQLADQRRANMDGCAVLAIIGAIFVATGEVVSQFKKSIVPTAMTLPLPSAETIIRQKPLPPPLEPAKAPPPLEPPKAHSTAADEFSMPKIPWARISSTPFAVDGALRRAIGEENAILYRFVQVVLYFGIPLTAIVVLYVTR